MSTPCRGAYFSSLAAKVNLAGHQNLIPEKGFKPGSHPALVSVDIASAHYGETLILGPLQLRLKPGETVAICGPSGIGKSTLLRILAGLETRFQGRLVVPERVAVVFQEPTLLPWRSVAENLTLTTRISPAAAEAALESVGLAGFADRPPSHLSLGQQRRVALARAFAARPQLLLLDEPFVSLDPMLCDEMMATFERLRAQSGVASILVTHSQSEARRLADRTLTLSGAPARLSDVR